MGAGAGNDAGSGAGGGGPSAQIGCRKQREERRDVSGLNKLLSAVEGGF